MKFYPLKSINWLTVEYNYYYYYVGKYSNPTTPVQHSFEQSQLIRIDWNSFKISKATNRLQQFIFDR